MVEMTQAFDLPRQKSLDLDLVKGLIRRLDPVVVPIKSIFAPSADPSHLEHGKALRRGLRGRMGLRAFTWRPFLKGAATDTMAHKWPFVASSSSRPPSCHKCTGEARALRPPLLLRRVRSPFSSTFLLTIDHAESASVVFSLKTCVCIH